MADSDSQSVMLVVLTVGLLMYTLISVEAQTTGLFPVAFIVLTAVLAANCPPVLDYALQVKPPCSVRG